MELFSKHNWKRFGWLPALLALLVLIPLLVLWWQWAPPVDPRTVEALAAWADAETLRDFGPPNPEGWRAADHAWELSKMKDDPRLARVTGRDAARPATDRLFWAPAFEPDYDGLSGEMSRVAQAYLDAAAGGTAYPSVASQIGKTPEKASAERAPATATVPNLGAARSVALWLRLTAERAMAHGEWGEALESLDQIVRVERGIEPGNVIDRVAGSVPLRAMVYDGYAALLQYDPPPQVLLEAIARTRALHLTDPHEDATVPFVEKLQELAEANTRATERFAARELFEQATVALAWEPKNIEHPTLRGWAKRFDTGLGNGVDARGMIVGLTPVTGLTWTTVPAARKFVRQVLAREPQAVAAATVPAPGLAREGLDPVTLLELTHRTTAVNLMDMPFRIRIGAMPGWAVEAALRARYFHATQDRWPESMQELDAALPLADDPLAGKTPPYPAPLLRLDWIETRDHPDLCAALWGTLPLPPPSKSGPWTAGPVPAPRSDAEEVRWYLQHEEAILPVAYRQALAAHPRLATEAQAFYSFRDFPNAKGFDSSPMSEPFARVITDWAEKTQPSSHKGVLPTDVFYDALRTAGEKPLADTRQRLPEGYNLSAHLVTPARVLAIHAPGPDGQDHGGLVSYDPTNGTSSAGDILAFPEKF